MNARVVHLPADLGFDLDGVEGILLHLKHVLNQIVVKQLPDGFRGTLDWRLDSLDKQLELLAGNLRELPGDGVVLVKSSVDAVGVFFGEYGEIHARPQRR